MKPIIIAINNGKISMTIDEFKKHIEDAYQQGYKDGSSSLTTVNDPFWWRYLNGNTQTGTISTTTLDVKTNNIDDFKFTNDSITATLSTHNG